MADYGIGSHDFIYICDCSMVTEENLVYMVGADNPKVKFISRIPATFGLVDILIAEAVTKDHWVGIGRLSEEPKIGSAFYRSYERNIYIGTNKFRAVVIYSYHYDKRKKKSIDKKIVKYLESAKATVKKLTSTSYHFTKDDKISAQKVRLPKYHKLNITIDEKIIYKKQRPRNKIKDVADTRYNLS